MSKNLTEPGQLLPAINKALSKSEITALVTASVEKVVEEGNVLAAAELLSVMDEFITRFRKNSMFVDYVRDELEKCHGKYKTASGTKIELCEGGTKYDYSSNSDWSSIVEKIEKLTEEKKNIEQLLKTIPPGKTIVNGETGEVLQGPSKTSVSTFKVYLSK